VFDVAGETQTLLANLTGHDGPVWMCAWAHPKFGTLLASCSFDHKVMIWKESEQGVFSAIYTSPATLHDASVNAIAWAPHEFGLSLACASSDGCVSVITHRADGTWDAQKIQGAHSIGCTSVSWAPAPPPGSLVAAGGASATPVKRLVTGGCDNLAKIWRFDPSAGWKEEHQLRAHGDWVRDVCWSVNMGLPMNTIASCGQDNKVFIWTQNEPGGEWNKTLLNDFGAPVWRLSWSVMGNVLAGVRREQHGDRVERVRGWPMEPDFRHRVRR
jgi:protein transport protein SEC13